MAFSQFPAPPGGEAFGTTAQRPSSPAIGTPYYNGTLGVLEIFDGDGWYPINSIPASPVTLVGTDVGTSRAFNNGAVSVAFADGNGGGVPTSYVVTSSPGGFTNSGNSSPIVVGGLASNTAYTFTAVASNPYGVSASSNSSESVTATTVPNPPTSVSGVPSGNDGAAISWTAPALNGGKVITNYTITPFIGATAQTSTTTSTNATSFTVTGLTVNETYTFKVKANNANGSSVDSTASNTVLVGLLSVEYLVVAGGGGGGSISGSTPSAAGGGGAGGYRTASGFSVARTTNYNVQVGAGGAVGANGVDSIFSTITSAGGGRGGGFTQSAVGGSGGGGGSDGSFTSGNVGTVSQGNSGGGGNNSGEFFAGGGGGGASQNGVTGSTSGATGGNGGNGTASSITGSSVTRGGGGAGAARNASGSSNVQGIGGTGGGGNGGFEQGNRNGTAGTPNTGGGGGGGHFAGGVSAAGGSGIVILRYGSANTITIGAGLTGSTTTDGAFKVTTITAGTGNVSWA
jgi:hypothetical protein